MKKDKYNGEILRQLQRDGRITNAELAERVNLSPSACLRRVQEMERQGVITGYRAVLDREKMGKGFLAYVAVSLAEHTQEAQRNFERAIIQSEEVLECHNVTGPYEYLLRVQTSDLASYKHFHTDVLGVIPQLATISTHVVMESPKDERA